MLRSIKQLYCEKLAASDGDIGHVRDFYFNEQQWAVRYVVADTESLTAGRSVLISPHAFGSFHQSDDHLLVRLTCKQIESSPVVDSNKPVSRQDEENYYSYYGWPTYWEGSALWGMGGFPVTPPMNLILSKRAREQSPRLNGSDPHLRSTKALHGYDIQTGEEAIGHVADFLIDDKSWAISHLIVTTGHWYSSKEISLLPAHIDRISCADAKVFVNVTRETIQNAPDQHAIPPVANGHDKPAYG